MIENATNSATSRQIELIVRKINSLSTLPCTLAGILPLLKGSRFVASQLIDFIESDPALTAKILSLLTQQDSNQPQQNISISKAIEKLPPALIRDAIFSTKIMQTTSASPAAASSGATRRELIRFSIAVACAAKETAKILLDENNQELAFSAGLLHNLGKLAIEEALPKSFDKIASEARMLGQSDISVEKKYLGIDHTIIGKRLAERWKLPTEIIYSIWLHRSDPEAIPTAVAEHKIATVVALAYLIARNAQIGDCGSYEPYLSPLSFANALDITPQQIDQIGKNLKSQVQSRTELLGLDADQPEIMYSQAVWELASQLAQDNSTLTEQNLKLTANNSFFEFANNFLSNITPATAPLEIANDFATRWQKFYNAGPVCVYLVRDKNEDIVDAIAIDVKGSSNTILLTSQSQTPLVPDEIKNKFNIIDATAENFGWLFQQIDIPFNLSKTKALPIICSGKTLAVIIWEYKYLPQDSKYLETLAGPANIAGPVISLSYAYENQQRIAEEFSSLLNRLGNIKEKLSKTENLEGLAEMAAGAAHELNNPVTIVSGRIQMLLADETDENKKQTLLQMKDKIEETSKIISDLMEFARPKEPHPRAVSPAVLIDSAVDFARSQFNLSDIDVKIENIETLRDIYVDSDQAKQALANLICNACQSYHNTGNLVKIVGAEQNDSFVRIQVIDEGCGMDAQTLAKAVQPFFSGQPAGRKRGMGLAHSQRLLNINKASLHIASESGKGTIVTVLLPSVKIA
jgi:signal transduction histidine kinase/HD-like signal output (HDOD) protein